MNAPRPERGDGVGIELTRDLIRGVRLNAATPGRLAAASEVAIVAYRDDRSVVDALIRLRAELGGPDSPTRLAMFPPGSTLSRVDATGLGPNELKELRSTFASRRSASSSVLVDDGPRRWLIGVSWDDREVRRLEDLAEWAGFVDVAIDPSPLALARVVDESITQLRRDASADESFGAMISDRSVVVAAALDPIARMSPALTCSDAAVSAGWFDGIEAPAELAAEIWRLLDEAPPVAYGLDLATAPYPSFPPHDLRAPQRQCVALGAAVGAAGLAGRLRPVDVHLPAEAVSTTECPWAIEHVSDVGGTRDAATIGPVKRSIARLLPRRR